MLTGQRATGGPVDSNSLYRVNEKGPELLNYGGEDYLMMGGRGGYVKPLSAPASGAPASASSAPQSFKVEIINQGSTQMQVTRAEPSFDAAGMVVRLFLSDVQDGGPMSRAVGGAFGLRRQAV